MESPSTSSPSGLTAEQQIAIDAALADVQEGVSAMTAADLLEYAQQVDQAMISLARADMHYFAEYVMRDEQTGALAVQAPVHAAWHELADKHDRLILWSHVEAGKTTQMAIARTLWKLGNDPTLRLAIVSNTHGQAQKIVRSISKYIEQSAELRRVFPELAPDKSAPWTSSSLYVKRPTVAKEPSVQAFGVHGNILGARIDGAILDDVLDFENTRTADARQMLWDWYHATIAGRLTERAFALIIGNAFHPGDLLHRLAKQPSWVARRFPILLPDGKPAWPERWSLNRIAKKREELGGAEFARQMLCEARSDEDSKFKREWIEWALAKGNGKTFAHAMQNIPNATRTYTGVDLAVQQHSSADLTVLFTIVVHPDETREVLCIESGRWTGPEIISRIRDTHSRYGSLVIVENNAAQDYIVQQLRHQTAVPVRGYTTGRQKAQADFGITTIGNELENKKWIIPNVNGVMHPEVEAWVNDMLYYDPRAHTGDRLMASWFAKEGIRMNELVVEHGRIDLMRR